MPGDGGGDDDGGGVGECECGFGVGLGLPCGDPPDDDGPAAGVGDGPGLAAGAPPWLPGWCLPGPARWEPVASGAGAEVGPRVAALTAGTPLWCSASSASTVPVASSAAAMIPAAAPAPSVRSPKTRPGGSTGRGKPDRLHGSARRSTRSRYPMPAGEGSETRRNTCSRRPAGGATIGSMLSSMAGLSSRRLRSPHTSQLAMCRLTRLRCRMVSSPSQPARMSSRSGQDSRPARATSSAPSAPSNWSRARDTSAYAWLRDTPSASARSGPSSTWRRLSSMTSRSPGFRPDSAARHEPAHFLALGIGARLRLVGRHLARLVQRRRQPTGPELAETFVAGHRVQPWAELVRVTQPADLRGGDDERVLDRIGRVGRLGE